MKTYTKKQRNKIYKRMYELMQEDSCLEAYGSFHCGLCWFLPYNMYEPDIALYKRLMALPELAECKPPDDQLIHVKETDYVYWFPPDTEEGSMIRIMIVQRAIELTE